jgi:hypothetical protein
LKGGYHFENYVNRTYNTFWFSKPFVTEIGWSSCVSDEDAYIQSGGLLDTRLLPKLSYDRLKNLISSWTTSGTAETDSNGDLTLTGLAGGYTIRIASTRGH